VCVRPRCLKRDIMPTKRASRSKSPAPSRAKSPAAASPVRPARRSRSKGRGSSPGALKKTVNDGKRSRAAVFAVMVLYMGVSVGTTLMNKYAFPRSGPNKFPFPFTISCFQMIVAVAWLQLLTGVQRLSKNGVPWATSVIRMFGVNEKEALRWHKDDILASAGVAFAFTAMLSVGNLCLLNVQISFYQAAKSQHILCNLIIAYFWFGVRQPLKIIACCAGVTAGFLINYFAERDVLEQSSGSPGSAKVSRARTHHHAQRCIKAILLVRLHACHGFICVLRVDAWSFFTRTPHLVSLMRLHYQS
jgi:hypothetical protein